VLSPDASRLPAFLADFRPDLIALSPTDNVVVEVKTQDALHDDARVAELARRLDASTDWRLELAVLPAELNRRPPVSWDEEAIRRRLDESGRVLEAGSPDGAALLWSAAEAVLRRILTGIDPSLEQTAGIALLKTGYAHGLLEDEDYARLMSLAAFRNAGRDHGILLTSDHRNSPGR